ncbi:hypothetical protein ACFQZU_10870, partial [Streptomonospora algeriensis]
IEGAGDDGRHTAAETVPQAAATLPENSEVVDRAAEELPLRNELPDPSGVLPLNAEVPGTEAIESQVPSEVPAPSKAVPRELSGLADATEQAAPVGQVEGEVGDLGL